MKRDLFIGGVVIAAFVLAFLWTPIVRYGEGYYSPADLTQNFALTRVDDGHVPGNDLLSDLVVQMEPWRLFAKVELAHGRLPLLNLWNGGGAPHLANYQSAVLSPFSVPYYVLPFKAALIVSAFLALYALGLFTFLFLRQLELGRSAALAGAIAFAFAGHNVLLVGYPHPAALVALPAGLFFAERMIRRHEREERERGDVVDVAGMCASLVTGLLAGHPETLFFALILLAAWIGARLVGVARRAASLVIARRLALVFAGVLAIAFALSAIQLVPFVEYLRESRALGVRAGAQTPLSTVTWPLSFFPNLLGNPSTNYSVTNSVPPPNFETANLMYVGCVALLAAMLGVVFAWRSRSVQFFGLVAVAWVFYAYDLLGVGTFAAKLPLLGIAPLNRSQPLWIFCASVLVAFGIEAISSSIDRRRRWIAVGTVMIAGVGFFVVRAGAMRTLESAYAYLRDQPKRDLFLTEGPAHVTWITIVFVIGAALLVASCFARGRMARLTFGALTILAIFVPSGWLLRNYTPISANQHFFPRTAAVQALKTKVGDATFGVLGSDTLPPSTNLVYGLALAANYDALGVRRYDELYDDAFGGGDNWRTWTRASARGLELFGIEHVLSKKPWLEIDTAFSSLPRNPRAFFEVGEILPGREVVQTFTGLHESFQALQFMIGTYGRSNACTLDVLLEEASTGAVLAEEHIDCRVLAVDPFGMHGPTVIFPPVEHAFGREYRLRISSRDATPGNAVSVWRRSDFVDWERRALDRVAKARGTNELADTRDAELAKWSLTFDGVALEGGLAFDLSGSQQRFEHESDIGPFGLYRLRSGAARYHTVVRGIGVHGEAEARHRVLDPTFDPARDVVLTAGPEGLVSPASVRSPGDIVGGPATVLSETATRVRLAPHLDRAGWLVTARPWYPGWIARVDGHEVPITRVNYAFLGLALPAGAKEVELVYEPSSVRFGAWISILGLVAAVGWLALITTTTRAARA